MLRTNTNKARDNIKKYIVDHFEPYEEDGASLESFEDIAQYITNVFIIEKVKHDRRRNMSIYDYFREWMQDLPSVLDTCYYCHRSAVQDLGDILEETEEERNKFTESQAEEMLTRLIFRELYR